MEPGNGDVNIQGSRIHDGDGWLIACSSTWPLGVKWDVVVSSIAWAAINVLRSQMSREQKGGSDGRVKRWNPPQRVKSDEMRAGSSRLIEYFCTKSQGYGIMLQMTMVQTIHKTTKQEVALAAVEVVV